MRTLSDEQLYFLHNSLTIFMIVICLLIIYLGIKIKNNNYKLYISSLLKDCGYKDINSTYKCSFYKPLISENLIN